MASKPAPAIRTALDERYSDMEPIEKIGSNVRTQRGLGQIGTVVKRVDMFALDGCPRCGETEMILVEDIRPESSTGVFYCTDPKCPHFVADAIDAEINKIRASQPMVWDNTAECPDCGARHTVELERHWDDSVENEIVERVCDDCKAEIMGETA